jgi:hypothetical protein
MSEKKKHIIFWSIIVAVPILLGLVVTQIVLASGRMQEAVPTLSPGEAQIATLQAALQDPRLDALMKKSLQEKLEMAVLIATNQAISAVVTPVYAQEEATNIPYPTPYLDSGIFEGSDGIIRPSIAAVQNGWQGTLDGILFQVFAGADASDANQGIIIVISHDTGQMGRSMDAYPAQQLHGWLRIESVTDGLFELISQDGTLYQFDLRSRVLSIPGS